MENEQALARKLNIVLFNHMFGKYPFYSAPINPGNHRNNQQGHHHAPVPGYGSDIIITKANGQQHGKCKEKTEKEQVMRTCSGCSFPYKKQEKKEQQVHFNH